MQVDMKGIPGRVLMGRDKRYIKVFNLYRARMIQEMFRRLHASFWERAYGGTDEVAGQWQQLKKSTVKIKEALEAQNLLGGQGVVRDWYAMLDADNPYQPEDPGELKRTKQIGALEPKDQLKFNRIVRLALMQDTSNRSKDAKLQKAKRIAWKAMPDQRSFAGVINVRTGRLVAATVPGTVVNGRYYAGPDQKWEISPEKVYFSILAVPHAESVDAVRTIIPDDISVWVIESHNAVINEVRELYVTLRDSIESRRNKSKGKGRRRTNPRRKS